MVQTPDGYLWFGTFNGLVRFDGVRFTVLNPSNTPELPSPSIVNLHLDRSQRLWVSTYKGVAVLAANKWRTFGKDDGWEGDFVRTFAERPNGDLLVTTFSGHVLEFSGGRFRSLPPPPGEPDKGYFGFADENGRWGVMQPGFFGHWDGARWVESIRSSKSNSGFAAARPARDGGLWVLRGPELRKYRGGAEVARRPLPGFRAGVWDLFEDSAGNVWICSHDKGLWVVATDGDLRHWDTSNGLSYDTIRFVFEDREQTLWVGSSGGGLMRFKPRSVRSFGTENGLTERVVNGVSPDGAGNLWIATYGKGLFRLSGSTVSTFPLPPGSAIYAQSVLADRAGRIWVGTFGQGTWLLEKDSVRRIEAEQTGGNNVIALFEDSGGRIWISGGQTAAVYDGKDFRPFGPEQGLPIGGVCCFAQDATGAIWLTNGEGIFRLVGDRFVEVFDQQRRPIRQITCLISDPDGAMWMGSLDRGLLRWRDGKLSTVDGAAGLPATAIHGIVDDDAGHFWMASNRGVLRVRRTDLRAAADGAHVPLNCMVFDVQDGLPGPECASGRQPICARDGSGRLWFATPKGVGMIDPARLRINTVPPPTHVQELVYFEPAPGGRANGGAARERRSQQAAPFPAVTLLPPGSRRIEIHYAGLSPVAPEKVKYQVKLDGQDADWQDAGNRRVAYYHNLRPGDYVFRVRAANNHGTWNEVGTSLAFTVQPFYWQSSWFRAGTVFALLALGTGSAWWIAHSRHYRSHQILKHTQRQSAALLKLSLSPSIAAGDLERGLRQVTELAAATLQVRRVGVWFLSDDQSEFRCADRYDGERGIHEHGQALPTSDHPTYVKTLRSGRAVDAADARRDPRTSEFADSYLVPLGITATLDAAVRVSGKLVGVVGLEHTGGVRAWRGDEIAFATAVADQVAQALLNSGREKAAADLRESEARFRTMANTAPVMIWMAGPDRIYSFFNLGWLEFTGRTLEHELRGGWSDGIHRDDFDHFLDVYLVSFDARRPFTIEYRLRRHDGEYRWVLDKGVPRFGPDGAFLGYIGSAIDVSERKRTELELQQRRNELAHLSRVAMLGELSGSLAHELNQPLTSILSNAQAAQRFLAREDADLHELGEILKDIVSEDKRAGEVIHRLRLLLKKGEVQQQRLDLNDVVQDVLKLVRSDLINHDVAVETRLSPVLPAISGDRIQLQQVIMNLVVNGCDAMRNARQEDRKLTLFTESADGAGVRVSIADRGSGISPELAETIFEPFFTTKSHGMGLGLAVCRTIITAHGGKLWATNNADRGASFHVTIPTAEPGDA